MLTLFSKRPFTAANVAWKRTQQRLQYIPFKGMKAWKPFHCQEWSISNFSCSLTRNITSHSMENLAFHLLLRWRMIILPIRSLPHQYICLKRLVECTFWTWEWKGQKRPLPYSLASPPDSFQTRASEIALKDFQPRELINKIAFQPRGREGWVCTCLTPGGCPSGYVWCCVLLLYALQFEEWCRFLPFLPPVSGIWHKNVLTFVPPLLVNRSHTAWG